MGDAWNPSFALRYCADGIQDVLGESLFVGIAIDSVLCFAIIRFVCSYAFSAWRRRRAAQ